jgi:hypothetical protein
MKEHVTQYSPRGVPRGVDWVLRKWANEEEVNTDQVILDESSTAAIADFSDLVGCWEPDAAFDKALAQQREISPRDWS